MDTALTSLSETMETSFIPIVMTMNKKLSINNEVLEKVTELSKKIKSLGERKTSRTVKKVSSKTTKPVTKKISKTSTASKQKEKPPNETKTGK